MSTFMKGFSGGAVLAILCLILVPILGGISPSVAIAKMTDSPLKIFSLFQTIAIVGFLLDKLWSEKPSAKVVIVSEYIYDANLDRVYEGIAPSQAVADKLRIPFINIGAKLYYTQKRISHYT